MISYSTREKLLDLARNDKNIILLEIKDKIFSLKNI
jgi:hypothetical protein